MNTRKIETGYVRLVMVAGFVALLGASGAGSAIDTTALKNAGLPNDTSNHNSASSLGANPTGLPYKAPDLSAVAVPSQFFGMHVIAQSYVGWPSVAFGTQRIWDNYPGTNWKDLNPAPGQYNWASLDTLVADSLSRGVEMVYTFGYVPTWASTNPTGTCNGAANGTCFAPYAEAWLHFVTEITSRYKGKIKYWELWNEPNAANYWQGSMNQIVAMARAAYPVIKDAGGIVLTPAPQGTNAYRWTGAYFAAGGAAYSDITSFHGYLYGPPESLSNLIDSMRAIQSRYGISDQPLWDTEHSWGSSTWPMGADPSQQSAWLARYIALSYSKGVARSFWYAWDSAEWGGLYDKLNKQELKPGVAYREVYKWMTGARFTPCVANDELYQCHITRANGYQAVMVWSTGETSTFVAPSGMVRMRTLSGPSAAVTGGQTVTIGMEPVLLESR